MRGAITANSITNYHTQRVQTTAAGTLKMTCSVGSEMMLVCVCVCVTRKAATAALPSSLSSSSSSSLHSHSPSSVLWSLPLEPGTRRTYTQTHTNIYTYSTYCCELFPCRSRDQETLGYLSSRSYSLLRTRCASLQSSKSDFCSAQ